MKDEARGSPGEQVPTPILCSCRSFGPSEAGHHLVAHRHGKKRAVSPLWHLVRRTGPDLYHKRSLHSVGGTHISVHTHLPSQTGFHVAAPTCCQQRVSEQTEMSFQAVGRLQRNACLSPKPGLFLGLRSQFTLSFVEPGVTY